MFKNECQLKREILTNNDIDWLYEEIEYLSYVVKMLTDQDEVELESTAINNFSITPDRVLTYTSLKNVKKDAEA